MRIALIRKKYSPFGGAERFMSRVVEQLAARGHETHVYSTRWPGQQGVAVHPVAAPSGSSFFQTLQFARKVEEALSRESYDIVYSFERVFAADIYRAGDGCHKEWLERRKANYPAFESFWDAWNPKHRLFLYLEKKLFLDPRTTIVCNSMRGKEEIMRHYGAPGERIHVIYNGIDLDRFHPRVQDEFRESTRAALQIGAEDPVCLFVGTGFKRKGLAFAIQSLARVRAENGVEIRLIVAGKGNVKPYRNLARSLGVEESLRFVGPADDVLPYYGAADCFLFPTIYEPFSNACLEALACGLPVVTTRVNGCSEILSHGVDGWVAEEPYRIDSLAEGAARFADPAVRERSSAAARAVAVRFPIAKTAESMLSLFDSVYRRKKP